MFFPSPNYYYLIAGRWHAATIALEELWVQQQHIAVIELEYSSTQASSWHYIADRHVKKH